MPIIKRNKINKTAYKIIYKDLLGRIVKVDYKLDILPLVSSNIIYNGISGNVKYINYNIDKNVIEIHCNMEENYINSLIRSIHINLSDNQKKFIIKFINKDDNRNHVKDYLFSFSDIDIYSIIETNIKELIEYVKNYYKNGE